jgi:hypothetical protein
MIMKAPEPLPLSTGAKMGNDDDEVDAIQTVLDGSRFLES